MDLRMIRVAQDLRNFTANPTEGISCEPVNDVFDVLIAKMKGPEGTPYEPGTFKLEIHIPEKYPFEPPHVKFITPIMHPNIDNSGRICMDLLKMPPKGEWRPTITLVSLLLAIRSLLAEPNPDDPLMMDIAMEYKLDPERFKRNAREHTENNAIMNERKA